MIVSVRVIGVTVDAGNIIVDIPGRIVDCCIISGCVDVGLFHSVDFGVSSSQMLLKFIENSLLCTELLSPLVGASSMEFSLVLSINGRESSKIIAGFWLPEMDDDDTDN